MSRIYLPTSEQMDDTVANLGKIAKVLGSKVDISTWEGIRKAVSLGFAPDVLPIGTQLVASHSKYGDVVFDVVAHDYLKSAEDETAHTMTLLTHNNLESVQYDSREAFYYNSAGLAAGTYNFTLTANYLGWLAGTYQFTLTQPLPQGGQLCISNTTELSNGKVISYQLGEVAIIEECAITQGNGGFSLGKFGVELNHVHRVYGGSNNYKQSAIRQFLNDSTGAVVWNHETLYDRPPKWLNNMAGFMGGFGEDFLKVVGTVSLPCYANNTYEYNSSDTVKGKKYTLYDKFYLPSHNEIYGITSTSFSDGSTIFPYYNGANDADRSKYRNGSKVGWWTRSPHSGNATGVHSVNPSGGLTGMNATEEYGIVVACTIV